MDFSQKLQHIGDKLDMFLIGNISRNLITALEFHSLKYLLIYGSKHGKYWFSHMFYYNFTTMVSTEGNLLFLSYFEHFWPDPQDTLSKVVLYFKKMHKVFKNKAQGCSTPLSWSNSPLLKLCCKNDAYQT